MNTMTYKKLAINLLMLALFFFAAGFSQPVAAQAQTTPTGTGKTLSAVLLGTAEPANEFPWQVSLRSTAADTDPAAKVPGMHKVGDITLKREKIG